MSELTRRYAQALYQVCPDEDGLRETAGALMGDAALWEALTSPAVERIIFAVEKTTWKQGM